MGWVDVSLIACESTLTCVYAALRDADTSLCGAACACLQELVKKGMEPLQKVRLLHAIGLAQMLALVPVRTKGSPSSGAKGGGASGRPSGGQNKGWLSAGNDEDDDDDEEGAEEELGEVVNVFVLELLGCWTSYEELLLEGTSAGARAGGGGGSSTAGYPSALLTSPTLLTSPILAFYIYCLSLTSSLSFLRTLSTISSFNISLSFTSLDAPHYVSNSQEQVVEGP